MTISSEGNNWFGTIFLCLDSQLVNHDLQILNTFIKRMGPSNLGRFSFFMIIIGSKFYKKKYCHDSHLFCDTHLRIIPFQSFCDSIKVLIYPTYGLQYLNKKLMIDNVNF
jgi:hypothetical protein